MLCLPGSAHLSLSLSLTLLFVRTCASMAVWLTVAGACVETVPFLRGKESELWDEGRSVCRVTRAHTHSTNTHTLHGDVILNDIIPWRGAKGPDGLASSSELKRENRKTK